MNSQAIRELTQEAHEILQNIRDCDELTYQQRNELMELVATDVKQKLELAKNLLHDWTGKYNPSGPSGSEPLAG